jgi:hypothetical protein
MSEKEDFMNPQKLVYASMTEAVVGLPTLATIICHPEIGPGNGIPSV